MNIPNKREVSLVLIGLLATFAAGRYSVQDKPAVKIIQTVQQETKQDEKKDTHTITKVLYIKEPNGAVETTTTMDTVVADHVDTKVDEVVHTQETITPVKRSKINLSVIAAENLTSPGIPLYGMSIQKEVLGPLTAGVWALNNGTVGISIGIDF